jgi:PKD repeat protein
MDIYRALPTPPTARHGLVLLVALAATCGLLMLTGPARAAAQVSCPNANPIVNENNCMGAGTTGNELSHYSENIGGFTTKTSYNLGESVQLKIGTSAASFPGTKANVAVYRIGYYGGTGARLISAAGSSNVQINNTEQCNPMNVETGELSCANWNVTYTIPGASLPVSGVYEAVFTDLADGGIQNEVIFTVRNDARASEILYVLPTASYEAYNTWGCKSLYFDLCGLGNTVAGDERAVAVSFDRPLAEGEEQRNKFWGPDYATVQWMEEQGYDITYTDDVQTDAAPASLLTHKAIVISGHSEYWSSGSFNNMLAAREHGVSIASFSANTAYWQTRYTNNRRSIVCYKTIQGGGGIGGATPNDPASLGPNGERFPALATTTRRDFGTTAGSPNSPPGGRVGVGQPENELFGVMYVGDNEARDWGLTLPAGNAGGEYEGSRLWRNSGVPTNSATILGSELVGWEWDQIPSAESPTYARAAALEPEGVKRISSTNTSDPGSSWLQDEGRERAATPPPGQSSNVSAVSYRAKSGAYVFSSGTMQWAYGFDRIGAIDQATYNVFSEIGVQPATPAEGIVLDAANAPKAPWPSFKATPAQALVGQQVSFDASASSDPDATITNYAWNFEGAGFTVETGSTPSATHSFAAPGTYNVVLKVRDSKGAEETTTRTVVVVSAITARLSSSPNPASTNQSIKLDASASTDAGGGAINDYKWDLDGSGKYATDTGATPTATATFATTGTHTIGVRESDAKGNTATTTIVENVVATGVSNYAEGVLATPSLLHYYRMGESGGPTIADAKGSANGTLSEAIYGLPGAVNGDSNTAIGFQGAGDPTEGQTGSFGSVPMDLSGQSAVTVEFWLKWSTYGNDDKLAMEFTPNYNSNAGGFIVDPDAPQFGGTFGVGLGNNASRNSIFFARPSAGVWHHYAIVFDGTAPAASEVTPYVDGQKVSFQQEGAGTGAGAFANSTLYLMSRAGTSLFGNGSLDELAVYGGTLSASRVQEHFYDNGSDPRPKAIFTMTPSPARPGQTVTFNASGSSYANGTIKKYEWDLNGDGTYETTTTTPTTSASYATEQSVNIGLRVTDSNSGWDYKTQTLRIGTFPPVAELTASPTTALTGQTVKLDASKSTDQGTITDYRWDLDGSGKYATDTGTTATTTTSFQAVGSHTVGVEVIDDHGLSTRKTITLKVLEQGVSDYPDAVLNTPGLIDFYKLGESKGPAIADSKGSAGGTISGGSFGLPGAVQGDPSTAIGFNGSSDNGTVPLNLSGTSKVTLEFWLKWNQYANNDALAMEFTSNFNANEGGFLVDPNAPEFGGTFGVGIGLGGGRNSIFIQRPSTGAWHHYVFVLDSTAPAASEIVPYVDGVPVSSQQDSTGTGGGAFANSTLYLMSRGGGALFGNGALQDLAIYNQPLSAATIYQHFNSSGTNSPPHAAFTISSNPARPGQSVTLNGSGSTGSGAQIVDYAWDLNGDGVYETDTGSSPTLTHAFATEGTVNVGLRVIDANNSSDSASHSLAVGNFPPTVKLKASPSSVVTGQAVTLNAGETTDQGAITDYKWDLDGSGKYATDTATTPTTSTSFPTAGSHTVGVQVTNDHGLSATATVAITVLAQTASAYPEAVIGTPGLIDYYRLDESSGPTIADSFGLSNGTISGGTFGAAGGVQPSTAVAFNGTTDSGAIPLNLSGTSKVTVEFWLKWNQYANDDALAMEFTSNFNENEGGFLVDPNSPAFGGTFGIGIGTPGVRNSVFFARPSAGVWHHYALVLDSTAPAANEITPYVDGQAVSVQQDAANTGAGAFANSTLYLMSRAGTALLGHGALDELAIYNQPLDPATIFQHYHSGGTNQTLQPSFTINPATAFTTQNVTFDASGSTDTLGTINDYRWDLDGSGKYATDTGTTSTLTHAFATPGTYTVGLETFDSAGQSAKVLHTVTVSQPPPDTAPPTGGALTVNGAAATAGGSSSFNGSGSFTIGTRTDYTETQSFTQSGLASSTLTLATATLVSNQCGGFSTPATLVGAPPQSGLAAGCYRYALTGTDKAGNAASISTTVKVDTTPPTMPTLAFSALSSNTSYNATNNTLYFRPAANGAFTVTAASSDPETGIASYTFSSLATNNFTQAQNGAQDVYTFGASATQPASAPTVLATSNVGVSSATASFGLVADSSAPTGGALTVNGTVASAAGSTSFNTSGSFTIGTRTNYSADTGSGLASSVLTLAAGTLSNGVCSGFGAPVTIAGNPAQSALAAGCYRYTLTGSDNVGNAASLVTTVEVDKTAPTTTISVPAFTNAALPVTFSASDAGSGVKASSGQLKRATGNYTPVTDACSNFAAFGNIGSAGPSSPFSDGTVGTGHCYEYEYLVSDNAGNSTTSAIALAKINTTRPTLTGIVDTTPGATAGLPQVGDAITLQFSDLVSAASIPSSTTITYTRSLLGSTTISVSGIGSGAWSTGDSGTSRYSNVLGTSAQVTATTVVSGSTVKLTVTKITDPSANLTAGGPAAVNGTLASTVKDVFGNVASTSSFTSASITLF